ncbi:hypothetical protein MMC24_007607 [Lignoscripta atroalba]|nr:hypothetical protein [Lignoscripta atroalba]
MCLVKIRPDTVEDVVVPSRPVGYARPASRGTRGSAQVVGPAVAPRPPSPEPFVSRTSQRQREPQPQGQVIVIEHRTPRTSGLSIRVTEGSYQHGSGPVAIARPKDSSFGTPGDSYKTPGSVGRTKGALGHRQSNTSYRSTRERVVIVDDLGTRREYYR